MLVLIWSAVAGCATPSYRLVCFERPDAMLEEIASGQLAEECPATERWVARYAGPCGWVEE